MNDYLLPPPLTAWPALGFVGPVSEKWWAVVGNWSAGEREEDPGGGYRRRIQEEDPGAGSRWRILEEEDPGAGSLPSAGIEGRRGASAGHRPWDIKEA